MNALFSPLDMTDYEDAYVGFNEVGGSLPISGVQLLRPVVEEPWPANHSLVAIETVENRPMLARSLAHRDILEARGAEEEEEEEEDEDYGDEGEEGEEGEEGAEADYGEEDYGEEDVYPPPDQYKHEEAEDRYFKHGENLRNKFNEVELDSFMKLLNVKPYV